MHNTRWKNLALQVAELLNNSTVSNAAKPYDDTAYNVLDGGGSCTPLRPIRSFPTDSFLCKMSKQLEEYTTGKDASAHRSVPDASVWKTRGLIMLVMVDSDIASTARAGVKAAAMLLSVESVVQEVLHKCSSGRRRAKPIKRMMANTRS